MDRAHLFTSSPVPSASPKTYREFPPCALLSPYVACYWHWDAPEAPVKTSSPAGVRQVIPDGCTDIVFAISPARQWVRGAVVGVMTEPLRLALTEPQRFFGIRFLPAGAFLFLKAPLSLFRDDRVELEGVLGAAAGTLAGRLLTQGSAEAMRSVAEGYLLARYGELSSVDPVIAASLEDIYRLRGNIATRELAAANAVSERQLLRRFDEWVGISPKRFCRIIRFRSLLELLRAAPVPSLADLALECGYYDQAHFTHEFSEFYGAPPSSFLSR